MKVFIDSDEWYPVYSFDMNYGQEVEVSEETLARWKQTMVDFDKMQREMRELSEADYRKKGIIP